MVLSQNDFKTFAKKNKVNLSSKSQFTTSSSIKEDRYGNLVLSERDYCDSRIDIRKYNYCKKWILLRNLSMAIVKSRIPDKEEANKYSKSEREVLVANNFLMPVLADVFQLEAAEYYNARFTDKKDKDFNPNQIYLLSPSFLRKNEELVHLANIVGEDELQVSKMLEKIEGWLRLRKCPETDIERVKMDFIKQTIFNRYIDFSDEHNLNAGIIVNSDGTVSSKARMAPSYDTDYSAGVYNQLGGRIPITFMRSADNGGTDLKSIILQYKDLPWMQQYLKEVISNLNIPEAIEQASKNGNLKLSDATVNKYMRFFDRQNKELRDAYRQAYDRSLEER